MLFTLRHSPLNCDFITLIRVLNKVDDLLLIQDGVIAGMKKCRWIKLLLDKSIRVYALSDDVEARGLYPYMSNKVNVINYSHFVQLAVKQPSQIAW